MNKEKQQESLFQALADIQRRKILALLKKSELSVGEIGSHFEFSGATLSHHLSVLKNADLVRVRRQGQQRIYTLNTSVVDDLLIIINQLFSGEKNDL